MDKGIAHPILGELTRRDNGQFDYMTIRNPSSLRHAREDAQISDRLSADPAHAGIVPENRACDRRSVI